MLSEAVTIFIELNGKGRPETFQRAAERACGYVVDVCGDKHLDTYSKSDANAFRDALIARGMAASSITRVLGTVRAVTNFAASEQGLTFINLFAGIYYDRSAGVSDRANHWSNTSISLLPRQSKNSVRGEKLKLKSSSKRFFRRE